MAGFCLRLPAPPAEVDYSLPQAFKTKPAPTASQQWVVDSLFPWKDKLERGGTITSNHGIGEDADFMGVHPRTVWALWRRGWVRRSMMDDRPSRDKWMLTDAAYDHLVAGTKAPQPPEASR